MVVVSLVLKQTLCFFALNQKRYNYVSCKYKKRTETFLEHKEKRNNFTSMYYLRCFCKVASSIHSWHCRNSYFFSDFVLVWLPAKAE